VAFGQDDQISTAGDHAFHIDITALADFQQVIKAINHLLVEPPPHRFVSEAGQVFASAAKHDCRVEGGVVRADQFGGRLFEGDFATNDIDDHDWFRRGFNYHCFGRFRGGFLHSRLIRSCGRFRGIGGLSSWGLGDASADEQHHSQHNG